MPSAPPHPCSYPGCPALVKGQARCEKHTRQERREIDERRGTAASRGYGSRWNDARASYLARHPLCVKCRLQGRVVEATVVDHIKPHRGDNKLFWDERNWQALCKTCHDRKTVSEGRWGDRINLHAF